MRVCIKTDTTYSAFQVQEFLKSASMYVPGMYVCKIEVLDPSSAMAPDIAYIHTGM